MINGKYGLGKVVSVWHDTKWVRVEYEDRGLPVLEATSKIKMKNKKTFDFVLGLNFKEGEKQLTPNLELFL